MAGVNTKLTKQIRFLQKIKENKDVLFGKFTSTITRNLKQAKWVEITKFAVSIGLVTSDKDYVFVRDNTLGNIRKFCEVKMAQYFAKQFETDQNLIGIVHCIRTCFPCNQILTLL